MNTATNSKRWRRRTSAAALLLVAVLAATATSVLFSRDARAEECAPGYIPLQVWDVIAREGRPWVFSIRTCQPIGLQQGSILLKRPLTPLPLTAATSTPST